MFANDTDNMNEQDRESSSNSRDGEIDKAFDYEENKDVLMYQRHSNTYGRPSIYQKSTIFKDCNNQFRELYEFFEDHKMTKHWRIMEAYLTENEQ